MAANKSIGAKHENMPNARGKGGFKSIKRLIGLLFKNYKGLLFVVAVCLIISAITSSIAGVFLQNLYAQCELAIKGVPADEVWKSIISILATILGSCGRSIRR